MLHLYRQAHRLHAADHAGGGAGLLPLVHIAPGDPLVSVLPPDASAELPSRCCALYGFDRPCRAVRRWLWRALHGDLGTSIATGRPVVDGSVQAPSATPCVLAVVATHDRLLFGLLFGFVAGYFRDSWIDKLRVDVSVIGVSMPHYWLGMVLVIVFSVILGWLPADRRRAGRRLGLGLGAYPLSDPAGRHHVGDPDGHRHPHRARAGRRILAQEFVLALRAKGLSDTRVFRHVVKNAAPTALAVMGLQLGYLLGGSILIETVFSWPGTGFLLNSAIFQRDLPLLQGTILVLALFFVVLNLVVDVLQAAHRPAHPAELTHERDAHVADDRSGRCQSRRRAAIGAAWRRLSRDPVSVSCAALIILADRPRSRSLRPGSASPIPITAA